MRDLSHLQRLVAAIGCSVLLIPGLGCSGEQSQKPRTIKVDAANDPLNEPRSVLKRYAEGQAIGSEVDGFPDMVARVRKVDAERADVLEKGLADLQQAPPANRPAIAKDLLAKLQPSMN